MSARKDPAGGRERGSLSMVGPVHVRGEATEGARATATNSRKKLFSATGKKGSGRKKESRNGGRGMGGG